MNRDPLDRRLLEQFELGYPRPTTLEHCSYDFTETEVATLLSSDSVDDLLALVPHFVSNCRLGLVGDWTSFPPFAGLAAAYSRRQAFLMDFDLALFFLHLGPAGQFDSSDALLLADWVRDVLTPWEREIERSDFLDSALVALDFLALHSLLGSCPAQVILENLDRIEDSPTQLISLLQELPCDNPRSTTRFVHAHFASMTQSFENQTIPQVDLLPDECVEAVVNALALLLP